MTLLIAILASAAAFMGGLIALRFKDHLHLIVGFSAGAVIGAALFDLIPEAIELGVGVGMHVEKLTALTALGFIIYLILDRIFSFHEHDSEDAHENHGTNIRGTVGAISFALHSLIDGLVIGFAFQASAALGAVVAIAVIAHRFSDGINTVGVILKHRGQRLQAFVWLTVVALAPILGALLTYIVNVSDSILAIILSFFAGFFLYIGASDLIPEGHHSHSKIATTIATVVGALVLYFVISLAH